MIFFWGIAVEGKLTLQTDPVQWVNQNSQSIKDLHTVEAATNSSSELGVFVQSDDVFSDEFTTFVHGFTRDQLAVGEGQAPHRVEHRDRGRRPHLRAGRVRHRADR